MNDFAFSPTTVIGTSGSDFGIVPLMTTSLYFSRESKKFWINPFPIKQFLVYIVVPFKLLLYILITVTTVKFLRLLKKKIKMLIFIKKETVSSIIFRSGYSRHEWNFIFFVVHGSTILIDRERWHKIYSDEVLHCLTWICVIPACCFFFDECLNKETPGSIFWQKKENKSIVSFFFINILLGHCVLVFSWISKSDDLLLFISLPVSWIDSSGLLEAIKKLIFFFIFKSTNSFRRQLSSRWTNLKFFSNETTLWSIFQIVEYRLTLIHKWFFDIEDHTGDHTGSVARLWPPSSSPVT